MSAYGIALRAIVANLFGLKPPPPPAAQAVGTLVPPNPLDEQLTVPGYYVSSPHQAPGGAETQGAATPPQRDALGAALKAARSSARPRVSSTG